MFRNKTGNSKTRSMGKNRKKDVYEMLLSIGPAKRE